MEKRQCGRHDVERATRMTRCGDTAVRMRLTIAHAVVTFATSMIIAPFVEAGKVVTLGEQLSLTFDIVTTIKRDLDALAANAGLALALAVFVACIGSGSLEIGARLLRLARALDSMAEDITYDIVDGGRDITNSRRCGKAHEGHTQEGEELHGEDGLWKPKKKMLDRVIAFCR
jgi:hypothetical protein